MDARRISSRQHPFVQRCREAAGRRIPGVVLLDGEHLITDARAAGVSIEAVLSDDRPRGLLDDLAARDIAHYAGTESVLAAASPVRTPSGVVALASWAPRVMSELVGGSSAVVVGLVGVQDPGNVGSVIRSAHALGATGVVALDGSADPSGWKALRGAMGSTFRVPVAIGTVTALVALARAAHVPIVATVAHGVPSIEDVALRPPVIVLVGNEGQGLSDEVVAHAAERVRLPLAPGAESLNVAVTAALVLWEIRRRASSAPSARGRHR